MTATRGKHYVEVTAAIGTSGTARERWRFTLDGSALVLHRYVREYLPSRRCRRWRISAQWGGPYGSTFDSMTAAQVPLTNLLAVEMLAAITSAMRIRRYEHSEGLPTSGFMLSGLEDDTTGGVAAPAVPTT